ncbi:hypothetical protein FOCG_02488 [Fusarium oxysporum f. sp. radicis-lycopersici 26381]|uniref:Uncharacterized protein n=1 Tax=Fusarium oxysporum Fo47 TaxID=660027 RepID=W9KDF1_FUSOX|nr:hypothetical protein FOZG_07356 [Fusarium oxysporum Fo47]EXL59155.1 hypothetical protein FOCG_02488 [Fusarium oxysporum f. sp. radicis-lycopersici 26381]
MVVKRPEDNRGAGSRPAQASGTLTTALLLGSSSGWGSWKLELLVPGEWARLRQRW